jgi:hypothetical protein
MSDLTDRAKLLLNDADCLTGRIAPDIYPFSGMFLGIGFALLAIAEQLEEANRVEVIDHPHDPVEDLVEDLTLRTSEAKFADPAEELP